MKAHAVVLAIESAINSTVLFVLELGLNVAVATTSACSFAIVGANISAVIVRRRIFRV